MLYLSIINIGELLHMLQQLFLFRQLLRLSVVSFWQVIWNIGILFHFLKFHILSRSVLLVVFRRTRLLNGDLLSIDCLLLLDSQDIGILASVLNIKTIYWIRLWLLGRLLNQLLGNFCPLAGCLVHLLKEWVLSWLLLLLLVLYDWNLLST